MRAVTRPPRRWLRSLAGLLATLVVGGCLGSPRESTQFLTLPRTPAVAEVEDGLAGEVSLGLGPVTVAPHLERRALAYRLDDRHVEFADSAQWAASLDELVAQYLLTGMSRTLGVRNVSEFPWSRSRNPTVQLTLHIEEFASGPGPEVTVAARWSMRDPESGRGLDGGTWEQSAVTAAGASASEQVQALSTVLDALADFLTARVLDRAPR